MPLELTEVTSGYGAMEIIHGVTLTIPTNEVTVIIGPNGAGKSTLLKTIYGFLRPTRGRITLDGDELTARRPHELVRLGLLYVQQGRSIFPDLTIEENLAMSAYTLDRSSRVASFERAYEMFPLLRSRRHQVAGSLSGGERRLLEMARIVILRPRVALLDEPSLGVAPKVMADIYGRISALHGLGVGFVIVEQNVRLAIRAATNACVLESGRVRWWGSPSALRDEATLRDLYLGAPTGGPQS